MEGTRMSLEEAGKLLGGLHPNTVRNRARQGKIPYEKDNTGKWWVFLEADKIANDPPPMKPPKLTLEPTLEPPIVSDLKVLEVTIQALNEELKATRLERDDWKTKAQERLEVSHRLEVAMAELSATHKAAAGELELLRVRIDRETDENRKLLVEMVEKMAAKAAEKPVQRVSWLARLFGAG